MYTQLVIDPEGGPSPGPLYRGGQWDAFRTQAMSKQRYSTVEYIACSPSCGTAGVRPCAMVRAFVTHRAEI